MSTRAETSRHAARFSPIRTLFMDDQRSRGRGIHVSREEGVMGRGAVPIGWADCAWDYEQGQGYHHTTIGAQYDYEWSRDESGGDFYAAQEHRWTYDEVGLYPHDFSDEMEDEYTGVAPLRYVDHVGLRDWTPDRLLGAIVQEAVAIPSDDYANQYDEDAKNEERLARIEQAKAAAAEMARQSRAIAERERQGLPPIHDLEKGYRPPQPNGYKCGNCGENGHNRRTCPNPAKREVKHEWVKVEDLEIGQRELLPNPEEGLTREEINAKIKQEWAEWRAARAAAE